VLQRGERRFEKTEALEKARQALGKFCRQLVAGPDTAVPNPTTRPKTAPTSNTAQSTRGIRSRASKRIGGLSNNESTKARKRGQAARRYRPKRKVQPRIK
jgi:hypothetical protein